MDYLIIADFFRTASERELKDIFGASDLQVIFEKYEKTKVLELITDYNEYYKSFMHDT